MGELMTEKGEARPFIGELSVLMGEWRGPEGPMDVGLSRDGCIPRWEVGDPKGEEVTWPDESVQEKKQKDYTFYLDDSNEQRKSLIINTGNSYHPVKFSYDNKVF